MNAAAAFVRGVMLGLHANRKRTLVDYGYGPRGLGTYIYDTRYRRRDVLYFLPDLEHDD